MTRSAQVNTRHTNASAKAASGQTPPTALTQVLILCTANRCRSPLAAAIGERQAAGLPITFESAGLIAGGHPVPKVGLRVARELTLDLGSHVSRQLDLAKMPEADVVLTMTREQARETVAALPELWPRVFTLKQFSRWLPEHPRPADVRMAPWLAQAAAGRSRSELIGSSNDDDVFDPLNSPARAWRVVAEELRVNLAVVVDSIAGRPATV
jgi:protein-tyrosine phosphatase